VRTKSTLIYANESMAHLVGYRSLAESSRLHPSDLDGAIHPDDLPRLNAATRERMAGLGEVSAHKFRHRLKDGSYDKRSYGRMFALHSMGERQAVHRAGHAYVRHENIDVVMRRKDTQRFFAATCLTHLEPGFLKQVARV
jgi:hypothetical protein